MASCKLCDRSGWFLSVTEDGLCKNCAPMVSMEVKQRLRVISDSEKLAETTKKLDTLVSRCDVAIAYAEELTKYEKRGIATRDPPPSVIAQRFRLKKDQRILDAFKQECLDAQQQMLVATPKTKVKQLSKVLLHLRDYKGKMSNAALLGPIEQLLIAGIHDTQLNGYLDGAKRAEFKKQNKKALDLYYEALYFLKHDEIQDSLQTKHISEIEEKIKEFERGSANK